MTGIPSIIANNPAVVAAVVGPHGTTPHLTFCGDGSWHPMLQAALRLMSYGGGTPFIRVVVGDHTFVIQREADVLIGVAFRTGDPLAKSLHRMIRRAGRDLKERPL